MHLDGINEKVEKLLEFIEFLNFDLKQPPRHCCYYHMGATLTDAILQSGLNYNTVVKPRINRILALYPEYTTTTQILFLINEIGIHSFLNWKGEEKIVRFQKILLHCFENEIESVDDFRDWILEETNQNKLLKIKGIGPKTIDYLKLLLDLPSIPIDRHLLKFAQYGEVSIKKYSEASLIYQKVSNRLNIDCKILDSIIWNFMSSLSLR